MKRADKINGQMFICIIFMGLSVLLGSCVDAGVSIVEKPVISVSLLSDDNADRSAALTLDSAKGLLEALRLEGNTNVNINTGPFVMHISLERAINTISTAPVSAGTYNKVSFKFHKYNPGETVIDSDFVEIGGGPGYSFVIAGKFNDSVFIYKSPKTAVQTVNMNPGIEALSDVNQSYNVTLVVNPKDWFLKNGVEMDPRDPANQNDIDNNIQASFKKAFKDNDKNGLPDP